MDEHPKLEFVSDAAFRLQVRALLYCARRTTDGFIPLEKVRQLRPGDADVVAAELVNAEVWHDLGEGCTSKECIDARTCHKKGRAGHFIVHDYLEWNHSKAWWENRKAAERERKAAYRAKKKGAENE
jgi:hypothetical protein